MRVFTMCARLIFIYFYLVEKSLYLRFSANNELRMKKSMSFPSNFMLLTNYVNREYCSASLKRI